VTFVHLHVQFQYHEVKRTYNTNVDNDYYATDIAAVRWGGANVRHLQFWDGLISGGAIVPLLSRELMSYTPSFDDRSFSVAGPRVRNALPSSLRQDISCTDSLSDN